MPFRSPATPFRTVISAGVAFGLTFAGIGLAISAALVFLSGRPEAALGESLEHFALAAYLILVSTVYNVFAYVLVTAASRSWRDQPVRRAVMASVLMGVTAFLLHLSGLVYWLIPLIPFRHTMPRLAVTLLFLFPGLFVGLLAVGLARIAAWRRL